MGGVPATRHQQPPCTCPAGSSSGAMLGQGGPATALAPLPVLFVLIMLATSPAVAGLNLKEAHMARPAAALHPAEAAVMQQLRRLVSNASPDWLAFEQEWDLADPLDPCSWRWVRCNSEGHITEVDVEAWVTNHEYSSQPTHQPGSPIPGQHQQQLPPAGILLPELAQMQRLERLYLIFHGEMEFSSIPEQWLVPGAFPRLYFLKLSAKTMAAPLPDILPGALPQLDQLQLNFTQLHTTLPASWGSPDVMPKLQSLYLTAQLLGPLPPEWATGFKRLTVLSITQEAAGAGGASGAVSTSQHHHHAVGRGLARMLSDHGDTQATTTAEQRQPAPALAAAATALDAGRRLPKTGRLLPQTARLMTPEWANGFPALQFLVLNHLELSGTIPQLWQSRGFPSLTYLDLSSNTLSGTLPEHMLPSHPRLVGLALSNNRLTGPLPASWSKLELETLNLGYNNLTGPALPTAWLAPNAMRSLLHLDVSGNAGLVGTLPANLSWPKLRSLRVAGTGMEGSIPSAWCSAPFAADENKTVLHCARIPVYCYRTVSTNFTKLDVSHTSISPVLPACANVSFPRLTFVANKVTRPGFHWKLWHNLVLAACTALLLGALAATALRQQQRRQGRLQLESRRLDSSTNSSNGGSSQDWLGLELGARTFTSGSSYESPKTPNADSLESLVLRRQRLAGRLSRLLNPRLTVTVDLVVGESLPPTLPHFLAGRGAEAAGASASPQRLLRRVAGEGAAAYAHDSAAATDATHARGNVEEQREEVQLLLPPQQQQEQPHRHVSRQLAHTGRASSGSSSSELVTPLSGSRQAREWRLATWSLHLAPHELEFVTDENGHLVILGEGAHAVVYLGRLSNVEVAVKVYELLPGVDSRVFWREVSMLGSCVHERIVSLYGVTVKDNLLLLAMTLMPGGNLRAVLQHAEQQHKLGWSTGGRQVALGIAEAVDFLHTTLRVLHGDLKSSNVLLTLDLRASIADMGAAQALANNTARTAMGFTCTHAAPEQMMGQRCTLAADIYSLGILLIELTTQQVVHRRGEWRLPVAPLQCPQSVMDLIVGCVSLDPAQRPTAAEALHCLQMAAHY